jgi:hypothetical protein
LQLERLAFIALPEAVAQRACKWSESARCKSSPKFGLNVVTNCNCVVARRGGEQQEVNDQSVG